MRGKRKRKHKRSTAHLKKYQFKKKGRKRHMAKRRKTRKTRRRSTRRVHHRRRRFGGGGGGGGGRGIAAVKSDAPQLLLAGLYGVIEKKAAADDAFLLNKIPRPIAALGYTGNIAAALYIGTMVSGNKWLRRGASVVATIALYKLGKNGGAFQSADKTTIGDEDYLGDEQVIDQNMMGALEAEAMEHTTQPGLKYDDIVEQAGSRA